MRKRLWAYSLWLMLALSLYFFENNAGSRILLICTLLMPLLPGIRKAYFSPAPVNPRNLPARSIRAFSVQEEDEPDGIRAWLPGDPVNRIHWKLSAKRDELLIRETGCAGSAESSMASGQALPDPGNPPRGGKARMLAAAGTLLLSMLLLICLPESRLGVQALMNRLYDASEQVNAYVYARFPVGAEQSVTLSALLLAAAGLAMLFLTAASGRKTPAMIIMAGVTAFQAYFGIAFPAWINGSVFAVFALWMLPRPRPKSTIIAILAGIALVSLAVAVFLPGTDSRVETASESVRDWLSQAAQQLTGAAPETSEGETETRRAHTQSLAPGSREARPDREYRLETVEEEQISMPRWVNVLRVILLLLLSIAVVILPFLPFLILNARRKKALEARQAFLSENVSEAVCAIFRHVIAWLEATGNGAGNLPFVLWPEHWAGQPGADYTRRFAQCAALFEEAAYSDHPLPEIRRQQALDLLEETEKWLLAAADWKQKLRLKYGKCLYA